MVWKNSKSNKQVKSIEKYENSDIALPNKCSKPIRDPRLITVKILINAQAFIRIQTFLWDGVDAY